MVVLTVTVVANFRLCVCVITVFCTFHCSTVYKHSLVGPNTGSKRDIRTGRDCDVKSSMRLQCYNEMYRKQLLHKHTI
jgi:hypothetical protein